MFINVDIVGWDEAEQAVENEMDKLAKKLKKAPVQDVLGLPADLGQALFIGQVTANLDPRGLTGGHG